MIGPLISAVISAVTNWFGRRQDLKSAEHIANAAWETAVGRSMENGWKDEYVTVLVTFPIIQNFIGNLMYAFTGNSNILLAQEQSMVQIGLLMDTPYGDIMTIVVLAAVGIKGLKALR